MGVLFLDPLTLVAVLLVGVYVFLVWRGHFRRWLGTPSPWTVAAWPLPVVVVLVPLVAEMVLWTIEGSGLVVGDGLGGAATYLVVYGLPATLLVLRPPSWLLPRWARERITGLPTSADPSLPKDAIPTVHGRRGHACGARWAWQVDGVGGHAWLEGSRLCFRAAGDARAGGHHPFDLDDDSVAQFRFSSDGELRVDRPRGGLWGATSLDVELRELDGIDLRGRSLWRRSGVLVVRVDGRGSVSLVTADVLRLRSRVQAALEVPPDGPAAP